MDLGVLIILNNFFHDLAAAMWFCGTIILYYIVQRSKGLSESGDMGRYIVSLFQSMRKITNLSLGFVCTGGIVRAINYMEYEWIPAMGREQITLLIVKHALLVFIVIAGIVLQLRLSQDVKIFKQKHAICKTD